VAAFVVMAFSLALGVMLLKRGFRSPLSWLQTGIAAGLLVRWGWRYWPWLAAGAFAASLVVDGPPYGAALGILGILSGPVALATYLGASDFRHDFSRSVDVRRFVIAGFLAMTLTPTITLLAMYTIGPSPATAAPGTSWLSWWFSASIAVMMVAPMIVAASADSLRGWIARPAPALALLLATAAFVTATLLSPITLRSSLAPLGVLIVVASAMLMDLTFTGLLTLAMTSAVAVMAEQATGSGGAPLGTTGAARVWAFCMVLTGLTLVVRALRTERETAYGRLSEAEARYRQGLLDAAAREQERIGRDVHDALGQELTAISLLARSLQTRAERLAPTLAGDAHEIVQTCWRATQSARAIARGLVPPIDRGEDLVQALRRLVQHAPGAATGAEVSVIADPALDIPAEAARNLYRIAQEALNNALKHSAARHIRIVISRVRDHGIRMTIADDGAGMDVADAATTGSNGIGLRTMQYRAEVAGGTLRFESNPGHGTRVICDLPRSASAAAEDSPARDAPRRSLEEAPVPPAGIAAASDERAA
jgi:two-component system, NarL family, sensor histidine kinase FusK